MRRSTLIALTVLGVAAGSLAILGQAAATQTPGTVGIRLLDVPQNRADDPRARLYIVDHLAPGTTINRRVEVGNDTTESRKVELYAASASIDDGEFRFGEGREANELTAWTRVVPDSLTLEPGDKGVASVTIAVPADGSAGERYGVVWAEMKAPATSGEGLGAVNRVGVRMYLSVGPGGEPVTDFEISDIEGRRDADGNPVVAAIVRNIGGRAVDLSGELGLTNGPGGLSAGPINAQLGTTIKPGQKGPVLFTLDPALPNGPWDVQITMKAGRTTRDATGTITFPDDAGGVNDGDLSEASPFLPIIGAIIGTLLLGWFFFWFFVRRKRTKEEAETSDQGASA